MEYYKRSEDSLIKFETDFPGLKQDAQKIFVTPASQVRSVITTALKSLETDEQIIWVGCGSAADKAVSCAEITKRRYKGLYQATHLTYQEIEEFWEPVLDGLDKLKVTRKVPVILILLSHVPIEEHPRCIKPS